MAPAIYPTYKAFVLTAAADVSLNQNTTQDGPYASLLDTGTYTYNAAHDFANDLTGVVGSDSRITTPTVNAATGVFDGDDTVFTSVSGATVEGYAIYRHNATANTTWKLVMFYDTAGGGLPVTPNGGNITIQWNASGIMLISDRRLKENIKRVGYMNESVPVYEYNYLWSKEPQIGVMAQDVEYASFRLGNGYLGVDYARI